MKWGETELDTLPPEQVDDRHRVHGCESAVWLDVSLQGGVLNIRATSDARLIKGLLAVLLARLNGLKPEDVSDVDIQAWFGVLGLSRQLSPSRSNGMTAVWQQISSFATA
jgi:cysteine desulfuration protein SufE